MRVSCSCLFSLLIFCLTSMTNASAAPTQTNGATVYEKQCAACHDSGAARTPTKSALQDLSPETIVSALESGVMRVIGQWNLNGPERIAVAEYLSGKSYDAGWRNNLAASCEHEISLSDKPFASPHWNGWAVDNENSRFQSAAMAGLSVDDVKNLSLQWAFAFPGETNVEGQPTIVDGKMYVGSRSGTLYVLDAKTGCTYWTYQAGAVIKNAPRLEVIGANKQLTVFFGDISGWLYALDAISGELIWKIRADSHPAARIVGGIQHHDGALYVGVSSLEEGLAMDPNYGCCTFRGSVLKIDAATGRTIWQTYTIDELATPQGKNKQGKDTLGPSGATVWSSPALDIKLGRLYVATSDNYSQPATNTSDSVVAMSMETGEKLWVYQGLVGDAWNSSCHIETNANCPDNAGPDEDMGSSPILITLASGKRIIAAGQKTGVLHVIDPDNNGKLLWQKKLAAGGILGGIEWGPASDGKYIYVAKADATWKEQRFISADTELDPTTGGGIAAVDLTTGEVLWDAPAGDCTGRKNCSPAQTAAVTAIPGAVFSGSLSGVMKAYDTKTGEVIWQFDTVKNFNAVNGAAARGGAIDGPGPVVVDGMVYVTSGYAKFGGLPGNVLLAFKTRK